MSELDKFVIILILAHIPLYFLWGWILFRSWSAFWEAICFLFKPELWSLLDGEYWDDLWAEAKLGLWFFGPIILFTFELKLCGIT